MHGTLHRNWMSSSEQRKVTNFNNYYNTYAFFYNLQQKQGTFRNSKPQILSQSVEVKFAHFMDLLLWKQLHRKKFPEEAYVAWVASRAFLASSSVSNWTKAKFFLIRTLDKFPNGAKCLSISLTLVLIGSKLMTNNVLVGLVFASGLLPSRLAARSPYIK